MHHSQQGFSLLEVLITLVVVSIGLLGVAGLQISAIKLADVAETRTRGAIYIDDILSRIRANKANALAYDTNGFGNVTLDATLAKKDVNAWRDEIKKRLTAGQGSIKIVRVGGDCGGAVGPSAIVDHCSAFEAAITIRWDESRARGGSDKQEFTATSRL